MNINKKFIENAIKHSKQTIFGIDYLQLSLPVKVPLIYKWAQSLDNDNSKQLFVNGSLHVYSVGINYAKGKRTLDISVAIDDIAYKIITIHSFTQREIFGGLYHSMHILGDYFRLEQKGDIENIQTILQDVFEEDYEAIQKSYFVRIDYKGDFLGTDLSIDKFLKCVETRKNTRCSKYSHLEKGVINPQVANKGHQKSIILAREFKRGEETGRKVGTTNTKTSLIRCYNKQLEIIDHGKRYLYDDYLDDGIDNVVRLEVEGRQHFCRKSNGRPFGYNELSDLETKCKKYMGLSIDFDSKYFYEPSIESEFILKKTIIRERTSLLNKGIRLINNNIDISDIIEELYNKNMKRLQYNIDDMLVDN